jgi:ribosomal protein S18 acetylase RimI-like enzyme
VASPERLGRSDLDAAAALLARAFVDEPVLSHLLGRERERERRLIFTALCRDVLGAGMLEGIRADGRLASVAVWMAPGAHPVPFRREVRMVPSWLRLLTLHGRAVPGLLRASPALDRMHPKEPHWFLFMLGTEPPLQQGGLGTALVEHGVRRAAEDGVPVHLDTGVQRNVKWFRRFGFEVADEVRVVPGAPPLWGMRTSA